MTHVFYGFNSWLKTATVGNPPEAHRDTVRVSMIDAADSVVRIPEVEGVICEEKSHGVRRITFRGAYYWMVSRFVLSRPRSK
jgi:hypothetical protein